MYDAMKIFIKEETQVQMLSFIDFDKIEFGKEENPAFVEFFNWSSVTKMIF